MITPPAVSSTMGSLTDQTFAQWLQSECAAQQVSISPPALAALCAHPSVQALRQELLNTALQVQYAAVETCPEPAEPLANAPLPDARALLPETALAIAGAIAPALESNAPSEALLAAAPALEQATEASPAAQQPPKLAIPTQPEQATSEPAAQPPPQAANPPVPIPPAVKPLPRLRLPNATAENAYQFDFDLSKVGFSAYRLVDLLGLEGSGLAFDGVNLRLHGCPTPEPGKPHEYSFQARLQALSAPDAPLVNAEVLLFVNPHPRSLWKQVEPEAGLPHRKSHLRHAELARTAANGLRTVAASVRGRSHAQTGAFREDDFHLQHDESGTWTLLAVSDGAGSAPLSRRGSQLACEVSVAHLVTVLGGLNAEIDQALPAERAAEMAQIAAHFEPVRHLLLAPLGRAAFMASRAIQQEAKAQNLEEKAYSATLLLAAIRPHGEGYLLASYWIGDGAAAVFNPATGSLQLLGEPDSGEYSGQTRFLLSSEFGADPWVAIQKRFRCCWVPRGSVLLLMSDGVSDPKFGTENALKDPSRWAAWWQQDLAQQMDFSNDAPELPAALAAYLGFWSPGEHDDRTLALVY